MHIPWGWIKQRPHFLAEELSKSFSIDIYNHKPFRTSSLIKNSSSVSIKNIVQLPFGRFKIIRYLNVYISKLFFKYIYNISNYKYIWITDLRLYPYIKGLLNNKQKIIYDCMDDILEFEVLQKQYMELEDIEKDLFENADFVLFSSEELKNRKVKKYNVNNKTYALVYNALSKELIRTKMYNKYDNIFNKYKEQGYTIVTYIGTISNWFDFGLMQKSLEELDNIVYFLVGPVEHNVEAIKHERIKYFGPVEHKYVKSLILQSDVLVMPFKLNKFIEAVDPIKMYEYIALGKNILSVKYDELDKFLNYIHLYEDYNAFKNILVNLDNSKNDENLNNDFIECNNWENRSDTIVKLLKDIF